MAADSPRAVPRRPAAPGRSVNGSGQDKQFQVKRMIPAEPFAADGSTQSERERELVRIVKDLQRQVTTLQGQVSRLQRFDGKSANMAEHQMAQAVIQSNLSLSEQLGKLLGQPRVSEADPLMSASLEIQSVHRDQQRERTAEVARNIAYIDRLTRAEQQVTPVCPCGEHTGIRFVEGAVILEDNLCPKDWWFKMSNHAFYYSQLGAFMQEHPFKQYLKQYKI